MDSPATWQEGVVHKHSGSSRFVRNRIPEFRLSLLLTEEETEAQGGGGHPDCPGYPV